MAVSSPPHNPRLTSGELRYFRAYMNYLAGRRSWEPQPSMYGINWPSRGREIRRYAEGLVADLCSDRCSS